MFRSRKSSTISPLQPPASTDPSSKSMQSTPGQQPQLQSPPPLRPPSQYAQSGRGQAQGFPTPQPAYAGDGIGRASSAGTGTGTGTGAAGAERVKEKRRSGFGWLGGKKKDKEKEEREKINVSIYITKIRSLASWQVTWGKGGVVRCVRCLSPLGSMISVQWNYLFIYFIFC